MKIIYRFTADGLFDNSDPAALEGIDQEASAEEYGNLVLDALQEDYPDADVEVERVEGRTEVTELDRDRDESEENLREQIRLLAERVWAAGGWYVQCHYGLQEFAACLGWSKTRLGNRRDRGQLPKPAFELACGPVWTHDQVQAFRETLHIAAQDTGGRPVDSSYDKDFGQATSYLIREVTEAGHLVETPVTGAVIVDGIEIPSDQWDGVVSQFVADDDLQATLDTIRRRFGIKEPDDGDVTEDYDD